MPPADPRPAETPPRGLLTTCFAAFVVAAVVALWFARSTGLPVLRPLALLALWASVVALGGALPPFRWKLRPLLWSAGAGLAAWEAWRLYFGIDLSFVIAEDDSLRLAAVVFAVLAFVLHFFGSYAVHVRKENDHPAVRPLIPLARLLAAAFALVVAALMAWLYAQKDWMATIRQGLHLICAVLVAEAVVRALARLYQPKRLRGAEGLGNSVLLPALFGEAGPLRSLSATLEKNFGICLRDAWLVRLTGSLVAPLALAGLLAVWLSTGVTRIPVDSRGVKLTCGKFADTALPPGLHFHAPWPWGSVEVIVTEQIREVSLGFERDLGTPVLWTEKHFEGEQNILVGEGEELLTVNVPVHYRIADPVAWLRHAGDTSVALQSLGHHELLRLAASHTAFGLMTTDREAVASDLRAALQTAADRLHLGVEIVFVGLKDIHPPVAVTPAYQDVVSAEEQRVSLVDQARASSLETLAAAQAAALQIRLRADSAATERTSRAAGEAARFLSPLPAWLAHPGVMRTRLKMEALESTLADVRHLYLVPAHRKFRTALLPSGASGPLTLPAPSASGSLPLPAR